MRCISAGRSGCPGLVPDCADVRLGEYFMSVCTSTRVCYETLWCAFHELLSESLGEYTWVWLTCDLLVKWPDRYSYKDHMGSDPDTRYHPAVIRDTWWKGHVSSGSILTLNMSILFSALFSALFTCSSLTLNLSPLFRVIHCNNIRK